MQAIAVQQSLYKYAKANDEYGYFDDEDDNYVSTDTLYHHLKDIMGWKNKKVTIPDLGEVSLAESFGGEGRGDQYWLVFKVEAEEITYWRIDGFYTSYDGGNYDGELYQVKPVEKVVIEYESI